MITAKAPGKLYIAGEYAVVENGYPAILVALNQFITCTIKNANGETGQIISQQYQNNAVSWRRQGDELIVDQRDNPFSYILAAIKVTEEYAKACHQELKVYDLQIDSQLDNQSGRKYGLGSSAAVTVATVRALCEFYHLKVTKDQIFKLAAIAHFSVQGNGSLGDVAASVYGGWIAYHSFDRQWLAEQRKVLSLPKLLTLPWPNLKIEPLSVPTNLKLVIGWTGKPASTSRLVDKIAIFKAEHQVKYHQFLENSRLCIKKMVQGFRTGDLRIIQDQIRTNRMLLADLARQSGVDIETPLLKKICQVAEQFGGAAKASGAGGGDCGIVAIDSHVDLSHLMIAWQVAGIERLPLTVHYIGDVQRYSLKPTR